MYKKGSRIAGCLSGKVLGKDTAQVSDIYEGFGKGSRCADAAGVYGGADLIVTRQALTCMAV